MPHCRGMEVFPGSDRIIIWGEPDAVVFDVVTGQRICGIAYTRSEGVMTVATSPDGDTVVVGATGEDVFVWSVEICAPIQQLKLSEWPEELKVIGGESLATFSMDGALVLWNMSSGAKLHTLIPPSPTDAGFVYGGVEALPGQRLVSFNFDEAMVWNATSGERIHRFTGPTTSVGGIGVAPGGIGLWDVGTGAMLHRGLGAHDRRAGYDPCGVAVGLAAVGSSLGLGPAVPW